ncbi:hypothetical protein RhiJN_07870 [Ceratobasidium sp. AG-Ba]|nr:hypothetical protein RhiJN_07870 [Ceratobasidium sp. AG-Ba]QRW08681.1 hypothetical protein RhiLY_07680 [Ceratobasidium sp. AG-Ba]
MSGPIKILDLAPWVFGGSNSWLGCMYPGARSHPTVRRKINDFWAGFVTGGVASSSASVTSSKRKRTSTRSHPSTVATPDLPLSATGSESHPHRSSAETYLPLSTAPVEHQENVTLAPNYGSWLEGLRHSGKAIKASTAASEAKITSLQGAANVARSAVIKNIVELELLDLETKCLAAKDILANPRLDPEDVQIACSYYWQIFSPGLSKLILADQVMQVLDERYPEINAAIPDATDPFHPANILRFVESKEFIAALLQAQPSQVPEGAGLLTDTVDAPGSAAGVAAGAEHFSNPKLPELSTTSFREGDSNSLGTAAANLV